MPQLEKHPNIFFLLWKIFKDTFYVLHWKSARFVSLVGAINKSFGAKQSILAELHFILNLQIEGILNFYKSNNLKSSRE